MTLTDDEFEKLYMEYVNKMLESDRVETLNEGRLCDITPTLLTLMGEDIPSEMTGVSLVKLK